MSFNNSFTAVTGATYTAAQYNTHTRDNFTAIWVYTTLGDLAYATSATTLARLAKVTGGVLYGGASGPAYTGPGATNYVMVTDGTTPQFVPPANLGPIIPGIMHKLGFASFGDIGQTTANTSIDTNVTNATLDIVTTKTCTIVLLAQALLAAGAAGHQAKIRGSIGGTVDSTASNYGTAGNTAYAATPYMFRRTGVPAGTITNLLKFGTTNAGVSAFVERGSLLALAFIE